MYCWIPTAAERRSRMMWSRVVYTFPLEGDIYMSIYLSIYLSIYPAIYVHTYTYMNVCVYTFIYINTYISPLAYDVDARGVHVPIGR